MEKDDEKWFQAVFEYLIDDKKSFSRWRHYFRLGKLNWKMYHFNEIFAKKMICNDKFCIVEILNKNNYDDI